MTGVKVSERALQACGNACFVEDPIAFLQYTSGHAILTACSTERNTVNLNSGVGYLLHSGSLQVVVTVGGRVGADQWGTGSTTTAFLMSR